jgi:hypothetical protein
MLITMHELADKATGIDAMKTSTTQTTINVVDALRGQQEQLKRLIAQKMWISDAPKATLSEMAAQANELKRLLAQLERDVKHQLEKGR